MNKEQERNLNTYLNNIPYNNKQAVRDHVSRFVRQNESFWIRTYIQKNKNDQNFACFIEMAGFVQIGAELHEVRVVIPLPYPHVPPTFKITHHADIYTITARQTLIQERYISLQKNDAGEDIINLQFPLIQGMWNSNRKDICAVYKELMRTINSPPLLTAAGLHQSPRKNTLRVSNNPNNFAEKFMPAIEERVFSVQDKADVIEKMAKDNEATAARVDFLKRNLPKLEKQMTNQKKALDDHVNQIRKIRQNVLLGDCESLLELTEQDRAKFNVLARQEGTKEGERKLYDCLEKNLLKKNCDYGTYRSLLKDFFEQMFEAQEEFLKMSDS